MKYIHAHRSWLPFWPVLCLVLFSTSCAGLFEGVRPDTAKDSLQYSRAPLTSPSVVKYVNSLGQKLFRHADAAKAGVSNVNIAVLETSRIQGVSSFHSPHIEVTRGMLNVLRDEAELAALISHEIGHKVLHRDRKRPSGDSEIAKAKWSQGREREADEYGAVLAGKAGYDPYALVGLFNRLSRFQRHDIFTIMDEWTSTHRDFRNRSKDLGKYLAKSKVSRGGVLNTKEYKLALAPLRNIHTQDIVNEMIPGGPAGAIQRLSDIAAEIKGYERSKDLIPLSRFIEVMDELSGIMARIGMDPQELLERQISRHVPGQIRKLLFMKEVMSQDSPLWADEELGAKIADILAALGRVGVGFIPVVGDAVDLYEFLSGREFGTGRALDFSERVLTAAGLLAGSGKIWREAAAGIEQSLDSANVARRFHISTRQAREALGEAEEIIARAGSVKSGKTTVLGHYPTYILVAEKTGGRKFDIPLKTWEKMPDAEKWAANKKFLDRLVKRGDEVILTLPAGGEVKEGSYLQRELKYLLEKGYRKSPDGGKLLPP